MSASIGDRGRVFKVVKTHVPREQHPLELQGVLDYEFYHFDDATGRAREFLLDPSQDAWRQYWAKFDDLVYDIHSLLKDLREARSPLRVPRPGYF